MFDGLLGLVEERIEFRGHDRNVHVFLNATKIYYVLKTATKMDFFWKCDKNVFFFENATKIHYFKKYDNKDSSWLKFNI